MKIINTADGSQTIFIDGINECYHSVKGAKTESEYVYISKGYMAHNSKNPRVFEVGFGTGLNCLLTALMAAKMKRPTIYYSIEKYPLANDFIHQLEYGRVVGPHAQVVFEKIHSCNWNEPVLISGFFSLYKINGDLIHFDLKSFAPFDIIYFDAFGPDKQPEMWNKQVFGKIYTVTSGDGIFVTYSAKGEVRRQLTACGFEMERLPGPPGKNEMLRGIKRIPNI